VSAYPEFRVALAGREQYIVRAAFKDVTITERELHNEGLPGVSDAPMTWAGRVAFYASKRCGRIEATMPYEAFEEAVEQIEVVTEGDADQATPTQPGATPGS
jgi:hypothetical protein